MAKGIRRAMHEALDNLREQLRTRLRTAEDDMAAVLHRLDALEERVARLESRADGRAIGARALRTRPAR